MSGPRICPRFWYTHGREIHPAVVRKERGELPGSRESDSRIPVFDRPVQEYPSRRHYQVPFHEGVMNLGSGFGNQRPESSAADLFGPQFDGDVRFRCGVESGHRRFDRTLQGDGIVDLHDQLPGRLGKDRAIESEYNLATERRHYIDQPGPGR